MRLPRPKSELVPQPIANEVLVYDPATRRAHRLNGVTAAVFSACQEGLSVDEAAAMLKAPRSRDLVLATVGELSQAGLVEGVLPGRMTRREALRIWGKAALVPVVLTVAAPLPAFAQSGCVVDGTLNCNIGNQCAPCTPNPTPDAFCAVSFCGSIRVKSGGATCLSDGLPSSDGCFTDNASDIQQDCALARAAVGVGNPYACCFNCT